MAAGLGAVAGGRLIDRGDPRRRLAAAHALYGVAGLAVAAPLAALVWAGLAPATGWAGARPAGRP